MINGILLLNVTRTILLGFRNRSIALDPANIGMRDVVGYFNAGRIFFYYYEVYEGVRDSTGHVDYSKLNEVHDVMPAESFFADFRGHSRLAEII